MGSIHRSCCPSRTFASPSRDQVCSRCSPSFHAIPAARVMRTRSIAAHLKVGCDNTVVRMVSSGRFVSRVSFSYRLLDSQELQTIKLNNVEDFCFNNWLQLHQKVFQSSFFKIKLFDLNWEIHLIIIHSIQTQNKTKKKQTCNLLELFKITFTGIMLLILLHITEKKRMVLTWMLPFVNILDYIMTQVTSSTGNTRKSSNVINPITMIIMQLHLYKTIL